MVKDIALALHILGGMSGLMLGTLMLILKKGDERHRIMGRIYVASMALATLSGIALAFVGESQFLFLIGVFSFYLCYSGWRMAYHKSRISPAGRKIDLLVASITLLLSAFMIITGLFDVEQSKWIINPVLIVFGIASLTFSVNDFRILIRPNAPQLLKKQWLNTHVGRMGGSYISALTAFLVVNLSGMLPPLLIWLGPSFIVAPLLSVWIRKQSKWSASSAGKV